MSTIAATIAQDLTYDGFLSAQYFVSRRFRETIHPQKLFPTLAWQLADKSAAAAQVTLNAIQTSKSDAPGPDQTQSLPLKSIQKRTSISKWL